MCGIRCFDLQMAWTDPPKPPGLAERIACDVSFRIEVDSEALVPRVVERLRSSSGRRDRIETERHAREVLEDVWESELEERCARALGDVHERYVVQAARVLAEIGALEEVGREAWIARAVLYQLAVNLAFDVLDADGRVESAPRDRGRRDDCRRPPDQRGCGTIRM